ncbi:hypothetical protein TSUD_99730 [Trifolium subterraneum]|uniref:Uncharacterized protein n=1 Tax=Trifolium subterraneum TaxID=3900 RepID=A0A2Z6P634_TRISU|nr:hypothetical protein TSUD_99730 [Trifolium subterraneum]
MQLDENPAKTVKIGANLPRWVQEALICCLKANVDVFATTPEEMPGINHIVACHYLNVDTNAKYVTLRRWNSRKSTRDFNFVFAFRSKPKSLFS